MHSNYIVIRTLTFAAILLFAVVGSSYAQKIRIGSYEFSDGAVYQGELIKGKPSGKGVTHFKNGDRHEGQYLKGMRHGHGVYVFSDGEKYVGDRFQGSNMVWAHIISLTTIVTRVFGSVIISM